MSTLVFMGVNVPEKKLIQEQIYRYHPSADMKAQILKEVAEHFKNPLEDFIVDVHIKISLKQYDTKNTGV